MRHLTAFGFGGIWPMPEKPAEVKEDEFHNWAGKSGQLKLSGLEWRIVAVDLTNRKLMVQVGRMTSDWLTEQELLDATKGGTIKP